MFPPCSLLGKYTELNFRAFHVSSELYNNDGNHRLKFYALVLFVVKKRAKAYLDRCMSVSSVVLQKK